jgi:S1/P1 Nuclease
MKIVCSTILVVALAASLHAWGPEGHQAIASAAQGRLSESARAAVTTLLGPGVGLDDVATWADDVRSAGRGQGPLVNDPEAKQLNHDFPDNANWHFVNFPLAAATYDDESEFSGPPDVVHVINACINVLEDRPSSLALTKSQALRFLIHFVGDIHQPLHVGTGYYRCKIAPHATLIVDEIKAHGMCDDRGGNDLVFGSRKLHSFWDGELVSAVVPSSDPAVLSAHLSELAAGVAPTPGDHHQWAEVWASESIHAAAGAYDHIKFGQETLANSHVNTIAITLPPGYKTTQTPVAEQRLTQAAARLADLLNALEWRVP